MYKSNKTVFVSNLPKHATNKSLEQVFSNFGVLLRCFVVRDKEEGHPCNGQGFVTFASQDDAINALKQSLQFSDNVLKLGFAKEHSENTEKKSWPNYKKNIKLKKSRLIVRNISFKINEEILKKEFSKFGNVVEVSIIRFEDGKMKGFAFIGFDNIKSAIKAISGMNEKEILGRPVAVDFALPREKFKNEIKCESSERVNNYENTTLKKNQTELDTIEENEVDHLSDLDRNDNDSCESEKPDVKKKKRKRRLNDVLDGKTIFVRNLSFETFEEDVVELMEQFGAVEYCKFCIDENTEHPKGSAFVKFVEKVSAEKCLEAAAERDSADFYLKGRNLIVTLACSKEELKKEEDKRYKNRDKRNLYLAREGFVSTGSKEAEGVSIDDLKKRLLLETRKRQALAKNLNKFVSTTRLCIHNLPQNIGNAKLRNLFQEASGENATITEARVMCERNKNTKVLGKSKGFGFITFTEHHHALKALRNLNNNPSIFTPQKRPIVEFSIEDRKALNIKQRRLENSQKNIKQKNKMKSSIKVENNSDPNQMEPTYSGFFAEPPKENQKIELPRVNRKIREMKKSLRDQNKQTKKKNKLSKLRKQQVFQKKLKAQRKNELKVLQNKKNKYKDSKEEVFEKIVSSNKRKRTTVNSDNQQVAKKQKRKWYEN